MVHKLEPLRPGIFVGSAIATASLGGFRQRRAERDGSLRSVAGRQDPDGGAELLRFAHPRPTGRRLRQIGVVRPTAEQTAGRWLDAEVVRCGLPRRIVQQVLPPAESNRFVRHVGFSHVHGSASTAPLENPVTSRFLLSFSFVLGRKRIIRSVHHASSIPRRRVLWPLDGVHCLLFWKNKKRRISYQLTIRLLDGV